MTLVTAIVPVFNGEQFIEETIGSVLAQSHNPIEIIVVDDGSTDQTPAILDRFKNVVTVITQQNRGVAAARNSAAKLALGEFIAFIDADDIWEPEKIELQLEDIGNAALSYTDRINFGDLGALSATKSSANTLREGDIFEHLLLDGNFITLSSVIVRKSIFDSVGGFNESRRLSGVEDWHLWLRLAKNHEVKAKRETLIRYRVHAGGISKNIDAMHHAQELALDEVLADATKQLVSGARSCSASTSAWSAANAGDFVLAIRLYLKALRFKPCNVSAWKGLIKCLLHKA